MPEKASDRPGASDRSGLGGRGVLITRPREQASTLTALVEAAGGRPIAFPALEIVDAGETPALRSLIDRLDGFQLAIFVSPTAAARGLALVRRHRELPSGLQIAAVGKGTARELQRLGVGKVLAPERGADSEALLALPQFADMQGRSVIVFRGAGGRELIAQTLCSRGATVEYAECYRRVRPQADVASLLRAWRNGEVHAVTVSSAEGLRNLSEMLGTEGRHWLQATPLFATHERIGAAARSLGVAEVTVTAAGDAALVEALVGYFGARPVE